MVDEGSLSSYCGAKGFGEHQTQELKTKLINAVFFAYRRGGVTCGTGFGGLGQIQYQLSRSRLLAYAKLEDVKHGFGADFKEKLFLFLSTCVP